jgi:probable phosphoglycerate mutase
MLLDCIRHGVTASNLAARFNDCADESLTGVQMAALRAIRFDASGYDALFASPMRRCLETAQCLGIAAPVPEPRIAERGLGIFAGLTPAQCAERFPDEFRRFSALDGDYRIPQGESRAAHLLRLSSWLEEIAASGARHVLAITHGGTLDFLYRMASGHPVHGGEKVFAGANAALSRFELDWPRVRMLFFERPLADLA